MKKRKSAMVLLMGTASLLYEGIRSLLINGSDFQVSTMNYSETEATLMAIDKINPDVFLICEADSSIQARTTELLHKLLARDAVRAVVIRQDDNMIDVYDKHARPAHDLQELLALLEEGPPDTQSGTRPG
jgi:hypothetical protein